MAKPFAPLASLDHAELRKHPESGMGYYILVGRLDQEAFDRTLIITNDKIVPAKHPELVSIEDLWRTGLSFPSVATRGVSISDLKGATSAAGLPSGYAAATPGAVPLLGTINVKAQDKFYRFLSSSFDHRFVSSKLLKDTYLTTPLDRILVNTGFGVVGRYALPIPVPASHIIEYTFLVATVLQVGTVLPNFGQAGGGVEVKTTTDVVAVQAVLKQMTDW